MAEVRKKKEGEYESKENKGLKGIEFYGLEIIWMAFFFYGITKKHINMSFSLGYDLFLRRK